MKISLEVRLAKNFTLNELLETICQHWKDTGYNVRSRPKLRKEYDNSPTHGRTVALRQVTQCEGGKRCSNYSWLVFRRHFSSQCFSCLNYSVPSVSFTTFFTSLYITDNERVLSIFSVFKDPRVSTIPPPTIMIIFHSCPFNSYLYFSALLCKVTTACPPT